MRRLLTILTASMVLSLSGCGYDTFQTLHATGGASGAGE